MTENKLEGFIKKASSITFQYGVYSAIFTVDVPGNIGLTFTHEDAMECIEFVKYLKTEFKGLNFKIYIKRTQTDRIDFTLIIDKEPAVILTIKDIACKPDKFEMFLKKQPGNKPLFLFFNINQKPDTLQNMALLAEAAMDAESYQPIQIHSWKVTPLGISD